MASSFSQNMDMSDSKETSLNLQAAKAKHRTVLLAGFSALLFIVGFGYISAYSAPACVDMLRPGSRFRDITDDEINWIASLPPLTSVIGNALSGYISHKLGRKAVLMYISAAYIIGWLSIAYAPVVYVVYFGRLVTGFFAGICSVAIPAYLVEISTVKIRGLLLAGFQVAFALGVLLVMTLGIFIRWSWLAISGAIIITLGACLMFFMPESPSWLARNSRNAEALRSLRFLRGQRSDSVSELQEMLNNIKEEPESGIVWREFLEPGLFRPIFIAVGIMFFQQFAGINPLMSYVVELFQEMKIALDPSLAATIIALVQLVSTTFSSMLMDRAGRKALYVASGSCMTLSLIACGVYNFYSRSYDSEKLAHWSLVPLICFILYIASFALGFGPIPWVVIPEIVPTRLRSLLLAIANVSCSFFGFLITKVFINMRNTMGLYGVYWTYAVFTFFGFIFYLIFIPETKGRTVEEIHRQLSLQSSGSRLSESSHRQLSLQISESRLSESDLNIRNSQSS